MTEIQGKSILVRESEGSSYRESTVSRNLTHKKLVNSCQDDRLTRFYKVDT